MSEFFGISETILGIAWIGLATSLGGVPVLFTTRFDEKLEDLLLSLSAGIMLAASYFSLLEPALEMGGVWVSALGLILGALFLLILEMLVPHLHQFQGMEGGEIIGGKVERFSKIWLFIFAIAIHNLPEGFSVGVGFASGGKAAWGLALGIGIQDIPEGFAVAIPLLSLGYSKWQAIGVTLVTAVSEVIAAIIGYYTLVVLKGLLLYALAFSAGAMIAVISKEVIPETHRRGNERLATLGLILGFVIMMVLDVLLG